MFKNRIINLLIKVFVNFVKHLITYRNNARRTLSGDTLITLPHT